MDLTKQCAVVIPCLNEARTLAALVSAVRRFVPDVFVVDDGSTDATRAVAKAAGATVLSHSQRRGKGAALITGCEAAQKAGHRHALIMDGDGQHSPEDIPQFLDRIRKGSPALVVGNRMDKAHGMPVTRRFVNWWMSRRLSSLCGQALPDTQCGFRLMDLDVFSTLEIRSARFEIESEVLLAFASAGHKIEFVPIRVIYADERSKINPLKDTWRWFRWLRHARERAKNKGIRTSASQSRA